MRIPLTGQRVHSIEIDSSRMDGVSVFLERYWKNSDAGKST
ncbi:hypothetical protein OQJ19_01650 [Fluoribacter gormanii]|nr:hypothetical protein [Fluoribacter gormanii]MCW8444178.1 hypothetical protein [Fluoribacter gormanii]MCW8469364.1 hypothetical protein [Fluoribacter gormanii]